MATSRASSTDRREHPRFTALALRGLQGARVKYGQDITVLNLSAGGVWFETTGKLSPDSTIVLEFLGPANSALIPSRVLRCQTVPSIERTARIKGACAFKRLLRLKDLVTGTTLPIDAELSIDDAGQWQAVVGKYRDGRLIHGYTSDFSPSKSHLRIAPARSPKEAQSVAVSELDALFFMQDAVPAGVGDAAIVRESAAPYGRKVAMILPSGEELVGSTLNYRRDGNGFFIHPSDGDFGVARVFVTPSGIRTLRFL
jgi:hypothetical protein